MLVIKQKITLNTILYGMLSATLLIDAINGFIPSLHLGEIFRIILLFVCAIILSKTSKRKFFISVFILVFLLLNICVSMLNIKNSIFQDASTGIKSIIVFTISSTLIAMYKKGKLNFSVEKILYNNLLYGPGLILISKMLGIGKSSYSWDGATLGSKGTFSSLNSMNVALMILFLYTIYNFIQSEKKLKWIGFSLYVGIPMISLGTKTSFIIILIGPLLFVLLALGKKRPFKVLLLGLCMIVMVYVFKDQIYTYLEPILLRQQYLFQQRDFVTYLFSTRNSRVMDISKMYFSNFSLIDIFPGRGYSASHYILGMYDGGTILPIEIDFADIIVSYGVVGLCYTYIYSMKNIFRAKKMWNRGIGSFYFWSGILVLLYGSMAGHVFLEAISSTFFSLLLVGCYIMSHEMS